MRDAGLPVTLIVVGLAWLAWHFGWFPNVDWIIAGALIVGGIAVLVLDGVTKTSVVIGPFLIGVGIAWILHEFYWVTWQVLVPALLVWLGLLMLVARSARFSERRAKAPPTPDTTSER